MNTFFEYIQTPDLIRISVLHDTVKPLLSYVLLSYGVAAGWLMASR